jgi:hypothetical protein
MLNFTTDTPAHMQAHFVFSQTHNAIAEKIKESLQGIALDNTDNGVGLMRHNNGLIEARTDNRRLARMRVQCLNEALCCVSSSVLFDSFSLRNMPECKTRNRYRAA